MVWWFVVCVFCYGCVCVVCGGVCGGVVIEDGVCGLCDGVLCVCVRVE